MAADQNHVAALLAALAGAQRGANPNAQLPQGFAAALGVAPSQQAPPPVNSPPTAYGLPQPTSSGSLDLSKIKPTASGKVTFDDAIATAKAKAQAMGVNPNHRDGAPPRYDDPRARFNGRSRSRSRSPPRRGDPYRDAYSSFRDERRGRGGTDSYTSARERERSFSPPRRGGGNSGAPYSPPPLRAGGDSYRGHRQRSPPPEAEQINIDASLVGLIIGRGGENLRRVEADTGARVQFMTNGHDRDSGGERVCNIQGTRQQIQAARRAIDTIVAENNAGSAPAPGGGPPPREGGGRGARGGPSSGQPTLREGEDALQIFVPDRTVGLIIGRGGETIRDIQDKSGCHVNIVGETKSQNGQRPVNLIGSQQAADHAKRLIMEIVESDTAGGPPGLPPVPEPRRGGGGGGGYEGGYSGGGGGGDAGRTTETIRVPIDAVGMIIGKGGETIKEMQNSTGCRINVSSQFNPADQEREITLAGNYEAISRARQAIEDKVEASIAKGSRGGRGGGGGGGGGGGNANQSYGGGNKNNFNNGGGADSNAYQQPAAAGAAGAAAGDPYAPYGGYENYCTMYYAAMMQAQQQAGVAGSQGGPPGT